MATSAAEQSRVYLRSNPLPRRGKLMQIRIAMRGRDQGFSGTPQLYGISCLLAYSAPNPIAETICYSLDVRDVRGIVKLLPNMSASFDLSARRCHL